MDKTYLRKELLKHLYETFFLSTSNLDIRELAEERGWNQERTAFWNVVDGLAQEGLIERVGLGGLYKISASGALHVEQERLVSQELINANRKARMQILLALAKVYDEQGELYSSQNSELYRETTLNQTQATANLLVLHSLHFTEHFGNAGSKITPRGYYEVERERRYRSISDEFDRISLLQPQPRGRALQKLIARLAEVYGWHQQEGVRTPSEEMDIIVFRQREYYLIESKWEKKRIGARVIRELIGKLENRAGVRGIVASMSGFTSQATAQVRDHSGKREILLFGPNDIRAMVYGETSFEELVDAKYNALVTKRVVNCE